MTRSLAALLLATALSACGGDAGTVEPTPAPQVDDSLASAVEIDIVKAVDDAPLAADAVVEDLGGSFGWSEGPVWIKDGGYLLFTDVPGKTIWRYDDADGLSVYRQPSTLPGAELADDAEGANGLFAYGETEILVPDHGSRTLYALSLEDGRARPLATEFEGKRFNSPNDVVVHSNGTLYFTDPPYGLSGDDDPAKELPYSGVFALSPDGEVSLVDSSLTRPNGIALSPDESTLYVAVSDPKDAKFVAYPVGADGTVGEGEVILDVTEDLAAEGFGNPDGMAVATDGTIFATGPGGLLVLSPDGEIPSRIRMGKPCANATFGNDGTVLYMTCYDQLYRVPTRRTGLGF